MTDDRNSDSPAPPAQASAYSLTLNELAAICRDAGAPPFRARQIWRGLYVRNAPDWNAMTDLPAQLRTVLARRLRLGTETVLARDGAPDAAAKLLIGLADGERIESVLIPAPRRLTICLSSQVGCRYRCAFCASGQAGFRRHLGADEIVAQYMLAWRETGTKPTHTVFMGIGEPLDNLDNVLAAVRILNDGDGLRVAARRITISTCGVIPGIERLAALPLQIELSVSLHAPDNALRSRLMPANRKWPLADVLRACDAYAKRTGRIVTFEYTLVRGVNDAPAQANALARLLEGRACRVNLIPLSPVPEYDGAPASSRVARQFIAALRARGLNATLRASRGANVHAACGQLRARAATND